MKRHRAFGGWVGGVIRRPRVYAALALPIAIPLLLAAVRPPELERLARGTALPPPELRYHDLLEARTAELPEHSLVLTLEKNDTLDALLGAAGLTRAESVDVARGIGSLIDVRRLRPGQLVRVHFDPLGDVDAIRMKLVGWGEVEARRDGESFRIEGHPAELREEEARITASIDSSLDDALRSSGEGSQLAQQLVDVFQWDIDFFQLRKGDSFSLVVRKKFAGDDLIGYAPIDAVRFTHKGTTYEAFRHENGDGRAGYYAASGAPLRKQFLKAPLKFTRVTSGFTKRRFHPVLKYFRPHYGVDYGAPVGTPVMSTADGVVVEARYKAAEGNFIRIRHTSRYDTAYLHLSRFAKGLKKGSRVEQGQIIGYVGKTGLASGPHLDYRVSENGKWLDPLKLKSITPDPLRGASLSRFKASVARLQPQMAAPVPTERSVAEKPVQARALF